VLIVTIDDDGAYPPWFLERLVNGYERTGCITCFRAKRAKRRGDGRFKPFLSWPGVQPTEESVSLFNYPLGSWGILYSPRHFSERVFDEAAMKASPTACEPWLYGKLIFAGRRRVFYGAASRCCARTKIVSGKSTPKNRMPDCVPCGSIWEPCSNPHANPALSNQTRGAPVRAGSRLSIRLRWIDVSAVAAARPDRRAREIAASLAHARALEAFLDTLAPFGVVIEDECDPGAEYFVDASGRVRFLCAVRSQSKEAPFGGDYQRGVCSEVGGVRLRCESPVRFILSAPAPRGRSGR